MIYDVVFPVLLTEHYRRGARLKSLVAWISKSCVMAHYYNLLALHCFRLARVSTLSTDTHVRT